MRPDIQSNYDTCTGCHYDNAARTTREATSHSNTGIGIMGSDVRVAAGRIVTNTRHLTGRDSDKCRNSVVFDRDKIVGQRARQVKSSLVAGPGYLRKSSRWRVGLWLSVVLSSFMPIAAAADSAHMTDPNDTPGKLDVRRLAHGHTADKLKHVVGTDNAWHNSVLSGSNSHIYLWISTDSESEFAERRVVIDLRNDKLWAAIQPYVESADAADVGPLTEIRVRRPSRRKVAVIFRRNLLGKDVAEYGWSVTTRFKRSGSARCARQVCIDDAPNGGFERGKFIHRL